MQHEECKRLESVIVDSHELWIDPQHSKNVVEFWIF